MCMFYSIKFKMYRHTMITLNIRYYLMGMVSSQLEILGNRLKNLGNTYDSTANSDGTEAIDEEKGNLELCIKEHQAILE